MICPNCGRYEMHCYCTWPEMLRAMERSRDDERRRRDEDEAAKAA